MPCPCCSAVLACSSLSLDPSSLISNRSSLPFGAQGRSWSNRETPQGAAHFQVVRLVGHFSKEQYLLETAWMKEEDGCSGANCGKVYKHAGNWQTRVSCVAKPGAAPGGGPALAGAWGHLHTVSSCFHVGGGQGAVLCLFLLSYLQLKITLMPKRPALRWRILLPFIRRDCSETWVGPRFGPLFVPCFFWVFLL